MSAHTTITRTGWDTHFVQCGTCGHEQHWRNAADALADYGTHDHPAEAAGGADHG